MMSKSYLTKLCNIARPPSVVGIFLCLSLVAVTPLFFGNEWAKDYGYVVLFIYSLIGILSIAVLRGLKSFFLPSSILFLYLSLSMTIGAWGHSLSAVKSTKQYLNYLQLQHVDAALAIFMGILAVLLPLSLALNRSTTPSDQKVQFPSRPIYVLIFLLIPFLFFKIDLSVFGGKGTIANIITSLVSISVIILIANIRGFQRYLFYALVIILNASIYSFSKRYAIFLVFPILFLEGFNDRFKLNLAFIVKSLLFLGLVVSLIIAMSIHRGYGNFEADSFVDSFSYIGQYISSDLFLPRFLNNIEANYFFFHAVNSIETILLDPGKITFGSTLTSFIFLPFPRDIFPWKPDGMITLYTTSYDPVIRARGGSTPINIVAELFWNFWFFAPFAGVFLSWLLSKLDYTLTAVRKNQNSLLMVFYLFVFMNIIVFARGGGTNILVFELLVAIVFILFASILSTILFSSRST